MKDLIEALQILMKYVDPKYEKYPTTCEHDQFFVNCVTPDSVSEEDTKRLDELGFVPYEDFAFVSYRFGSN